MKMLRIIVLMTMFLMPMRAQAAITIDFGAIAGTIQSVVTNVKVKIDRIKANVMEWKIVQTLGSALKSVSEFFQKLEKEYKKQKEKFDMWREDITRFLSDMEAYYTATLDVYQKALDTAEYLAEIGARFQAYLAEGESIIKDSGDTIKMCGNNLVELVNVVKQAKDQWAELQANYDRYEARKEELERQLANLQKHEESNAVTNEIRNLRDQLQNHLAQIDNVKQGIRSVKNQFYNHIAEQKSLIYACKYNVQAIKARIKRLICNMTIGELKGFEDQARKLGNSLNNWNQKVENLQIDAYELDTNDASGCVNYCTECSYGTPFASDQKAAEKSQDEACEKCAECKPLPYSSACEGKEEGENCESATALIKVNTLPHGSVQCEREIEQLAKGPDDYSCSKYKKKCDEGDGEACQISCSSMCGSIPAGDDVCCRIAAEKCSGGHGGYCDNYKNNCATYDANKSASACKAMKQDCDRAREELIEGSEMEEPMECETYKTMCGGQYSYNYSVSHSSAIAYADVDLSNIKNIKSGTNEAGVFLLPNSLAICCELDADKVMQDGVLRDCITRYNDVMNRNNYETNPDDPDAKISEADKKFFQCLRKDMGSEEFNDKVKQSDKELAGISLENALAEYLAAGYLEAMQAYNDSFSFKNDQIDPVVNTKNKDMQAAWDIAIDLNLKIGDRLNAISNLWAREQMTRSFMNVKSYRLSDSFISTCQDPDKAENAAGNKGE